MTGRQVRAAGERLDVQRLCVLAVDPVSKLQVASRAEAISTVRQAGLGP
jgi:hypothetical protein